MLRLILEEKNMTLYALEKKSKIKHATLNDIYNERCKIENCSFITVKKIADALNMNIESLFNILSYKDMHYLTYNNHFDLFKSNICQELKSSNELDFIKKYLSNNLLNEYYQNKEYDKAFYLLSMIEYLLEKNNLPIPDSFKKFDQVKLKKISVQQSLYILLKMRLKNYSDIVKEAIPNFYKHHIVEAEIDHVA